MSDDELTALLYAWARYVIAGNRSRPARLIASYAENIGAGSFGQAYVPDIDEVVLRADEIIKEMDSGFREALYMRYVQPGPIKSKLPDRVKRSEFYVMLKFARVRLADALSDKKSVARVQAI